MNLKLFLQWLSRRSVILIVILLLAVAVLLVWFISVGFSPNTEHVLIGIAAISAMLSMISAFANLLQAVEVQKQRQSEERPYVIAYFDGASNGAIYFVIENSGNSPAINVNFQFTPTPVDFANRPLNQISLFARPISFLPAGKVLRQIVDAGYRFLAEGKPTRFSICVNYTSIFHEAYQETLDYDLEYMRQATIPGKTAEDHLKIISEGLDKLVRLLEKAQGTSPLLIETLDQRGNRLKREREEMVELPKWKSYLLSLLRWISSKIQ